MPKVLIPPPYRGPTQGQAEVWVEGDTLQECLDAVEARYPGFRDLISDADGQLSDFVRLFVNGAPVDTAELDVHVARDAEISVLAAIAGG
jgi:molybdopterin synthase sulfur carrier subunit